MSSYQSYFDKRYVDYITTIATKHNRTMDTELGLISSLFDLPTDQLYHYLNHGSTFVRDDHD